MVSKAIKIAKKKHKIMESVDKKQAPEVPIKRPKKRQEKTLKKGKTRMQRNIKKMKIF